MIDIYSELRKRLFLQLEAKPVYEPYVQSLPWFLRA